MEAYKQRVIDERNALQSKYMKLGAFINDPETFSTTSAKEGILLIEQHAAMGLYLVILCKRLAIWFA